MLTTKTLAVAIAAVAISSVSAHAAARQTNPLHPAYHAERTVGEFQYLPRIRPMLSRYLTGATASGDHHPRPP